MVTMNAAVVTSFYEPPHVQRMALPPAGPGELVEVVAVAVHPEVREVAAGSRAEELGDPPLVPGVDGVGRRADGTLVYFLAASDLIGTLAERAVALPHRVVALPAGVDPAAVAATMLPALMAGASFTELPAVMTRVAAGEPAVRTRSVPLRDLEQAWLEPERPGVCLVVVP